MRTNFWLTLTWFFLQGCSALISPTQKLGGLPAEIRTTPSLLAYWQGNSQLGQVADASGNSRNLVVINSVLNPATPQPAEGDRWLGSNFFSTNGAFKVPTDAIPSNDHGKFVVIFYQATLACCGARAHQVILSLKNMDGSRYMNFGYADAGVRGFYVDYSGPGGGHISLGEVRSPNLKEEAGVTVTVEVSWSAEGVRLKENGVLINKTDPPFDHGIVTGAWLGARGEELEDKTQNYLDAAAFYSDIDAPYPPVLH